MDLRQIFFRDHTLIDPQYTGSGSGFYRLISTFLPTVYVIAGFILFLYFIFGGFLLISSGSNSKQAESGKQALTNAMLGFIIIFVSYWIIQIVQILTGVPIVKVL